MCASLGTFLLRRNTRRASIKLIEWTQLAVVVSREAYQETYEKNTSLTTLFCEYQRIADNRKKDTLLKSQSLNFFSYIYFKFLTHDAHNYTKVYPKRRFDGLLLSIVKH